MNHGLLQCIYLERFPTNYFLSLSLSLSLALSQNTMVVPTTRPTNHSNHLCLAIFRWKCSRSLHSCNVAHHLLVTRSPLLRYGRQVQPRSHCRCDHQMLLDSNFGSGNHSIWVLYHASSRGLFGFDFLYWIQIFGIDHQHVVWTTVGICLGLWHVGILCHLFVDGVGGFLFHAQDHDLLHSGTHSTWWTKEELYGIGIRGIAGGHHVVCESN